MPDGNTEQNTTRALVSPPMRQQRKNKPLKRFKTNRGRPRACNAQRPHGGDPGTPELAMKRALGATAEPIDLCLERGLITPEQHRCALHLRWLHTIRHGAPGVTALDWSRGPGKDLFEEDDPRWRAHRERDYREALALLRARGYAAELLPCIVYGEPPAFLNHARFHAAFTDPAQADAIQREAARFAEGLELLVECWGRRLNP